MASVSEIWKITASIIMSIDYLIVCTLITMKINQVIKARILEHLNQ